MDTIFAVATARGRAGIAVIRMSGPLAWSAARRLSGALPPPRHAALRSLRSDGDLLDEGLVLLFEENASFTGEQSAELQVHGSSAAVQSVLRALSSVPGLRPAEAGEFTRRAVENGRLDLSQAEGLADLIDAETDAQRRQAQQALSGTLGRKAEGWRKALVEAAALIEAHMDFADEDIPDDVLGGLGARLHLLADQLGDELGRYAVSERIRDGFEVAIVGLPNVGKSTLLNLLSGRDVAITSEHAGTTRDVIEVRMDLDGLPVTVIDTAGIRVSDDPIEAIGVQRTRLRAAAADLRIFLMEPGTMPDMEAQAGDLFVTAKADRYPSSGTGLRVSGTTGTGVDDLVRAIAGSLSARAARPAIITRERHRAAMAKAADALGRACTVLTEDAGHPEIAAENLRAAIRALDSLVGRVDVEHLLDEIFARFCIGK